MAYNILGPITISGSLVTPNFGSQTIITTGEVRAVTHTIGTSGGPVITSGTGAPTASDPNGSVWLRSDGTGASDAVYSRQGGAWYSVTGSGAFSAGGDLTGSSSSQQVVSLTGSGGILSIATTAATIRWNIATTSPTLNQTDDSTASVTAQNLTIQAQNATGTTSTGGNLSLRAGTGTSNHGRIDFVTGTPVGGRIWQTGAWAIGNTATNDTSSAAQAGLTGSLVSLSAVTGGTLTSASNQAINYNNAGINTLQGHAGARFITNTTTVMNIGTTSADALKFGVGLSSPPTVSSGTGVPATSENNGSVFMRTDGSGASNGLYTRQGGAWYALASGGGGGGVVNVANLTALAALNDSAYTGGELAWVESLDAYFSYPDVLLTAEPFRIVTSSNNKSWTRLHIPSKKWQAQATWYIDNVAGDNEASGASSGTALASIDEWERRIGGELSKSTVINLTDTYSDNIALTIRVADIGRDNSHPVPTLEIRGDNTTVSESFTTGASAATHTDFTGNTLGTVDDVANTVNFSNYIGYEVRNTGNTVKARIVAGTVGSGNVGYWNDGNGNTVTPPAASTALKIVDEAVFSGGAISISFETGDNLDVSGSNIPALRLVNLRINNEIIFNEITSVLFSNCHIIGNIHKSGSDFHAVHTSFSGAELIIYRNVKLTHTCHNTHFTLDGIGRVVSIGGAVDSILYPVMVNNKFKITGSRSIYVESPAVFNGDGIFINSVGKVKLNGPFGNGNTFGLQVDHGANVVVTNGGKITGSSEIEFDAQASAISPLIASSSVPASSTLGTWSNLNGSPFNGIYMSYLYGTVVTSS